MSSMGRNCRAVTTPTSNPLPVIRSTSHPRATVCIQVPLVDTSWP